MKKGIYWIASYPKSGNTWVRIFLDNLLSGSTEPVSINRLSKVLIACSRNMFDDQVGIESSDLTADEVDNLRSRLYEHLAAKYDPPLLSKIHDAYTYTREGRPLVTEKATAGVIYIIRNPLDVTVSFSAHFGCSIDKTIQRMSDPEYALVKKNTMIFHQFRQKLLSWSGHVKSWLSSGLPVCLIRYEDLKEHPTQTFERIVRFLDLEYSTNDISKAMSFSSFDALKNQEKASGFREKPPSASSFFRKGVIGSWRKELLPSQIERITDNHKEVMDQFGYQDHDDSGVFTIERIMYDHLKEEPWNKTNSTTPRLNQSQGKMKTNASGPPPNW